MKLEAVVICVNYCDFLAFTLPTNVKMFNKMVVVTDSNDFATKRLCEYYGVQCVVTDCFYENGDKFNKGRAINEGLKYLDKDAWILHIDADIYLPPLTASILSMLDLDKTCIYGLDRFMVQSFNDWLQHLSLPHLLHEAGIYIHTTSFNIGVRISQYEIEGYLPIGFFQLWHADSNIMQYPKNYGGADRTDIQFSKLFAKEKRKFIPDLIVYHLESNLEKMSANWLGRTTEYFGGKKIESSIKKFNEQESITNIKLEKGVNLVELIQSSKKPYN